jgi:glutamate 5-kinase
LNPEGIHDERIAVQEVKDIGQLEVDTGGGGTTWGTGGMATKLTAARIATAAGCTVAICNACKPEAVDEIIVGGDAGTVFRPLRTEVTSRKRWILAGTSCEAFHELVIPPPFPP